MLSCWQKGAWSAMPAMLLLKTCQGDSVCFGYLWIQLVHSCSVSFQLRKTLRSLWISLSPVQGSHCFQLKSKAFFHLLLQGRRVSGPFNNWHQFSKALNQALPCGFLNAEVPWTTLVHNLPQCTSPEHACDQYLQGSIDIPAWWSDVAAASTLTIDAPRIASRATITKVTGHSQDALANILPCTLLHQKESCWLLSLFILALWDV